MNNIITKAFKLQRGKDAHEIARKAKIKRLERRRPATASMPLQSSRPPGSLRLTDHIAVMEKTLAPPLYTEDQTLLLTLLFLSNSF